MMFRQWSKSGGNPTEDSGIFARIVPYSVSRSNRMSSICADTFNRLHIVSYYAKNALVQGCIQCVMIGRRRYSRLISNRSGRHADEYFADTWAARQRPGARPQSQSRWSFGDHCRPIQMAIEQAIPGG